MKRDAYKLFRFAWQGIAVVMLCMLPLLVSCRSSKGVAGHGAVSDNPGSGVHIGKITDRQHHIIEEAYTWLGTPYRYAGVDKGDGVDCSGMVMKVYETVTGEKIPRNSAKQAEFCSRLDADDVDAGDLIFFATGSDPEKVSHVGIIIDNENFIHASSSKGVVVSKYTTPYYQRTFMMFGRVPVNHLVSEANDK